MRAFYFRVTVKNVAIWEGGGGGGERSPIQVRKNLGHGILLQEKPKREDYKGNQQLGQGQDVEGMFSSLTSLG